MSEVQLLLSLERAIHAGLDYLHAAQLDYGEFKGDRYSVSSLLGAPDLDSSPFVTTFVLYSIGFADPDIIRDVVNRGLGFLLEERTSDGVWSYRSSRNYTRMTGLDPDVDTTACAHFIVRELAPSCVHPATGAALLSNTSEDGLFKTWLRNSQGPNDVDSVVNANVLLCLGESTATVATIAWLSSCVLGGYEAASTWYYLDEVTVHYTIARAYLHSAPSLKSCRAAILQKILAMRSRAGGYGTPLRTGMALATSMNYGGLQMSYYDIRAALQQLMLTQGVQGNWDAEALYAGPEPPRPHHTWCGSPELTTAICLEALCKCKSWIESGLSEGWSPLVCWNKMKCSIGGSM